MSSGLEKGPLFFSRRFLVLRSFGDFVGLGGLVLEEAEGGVALAEDTCLQQAAETLGELESAAVLGDYDAAEIKKGSVAEEAENAIVLCCFRVGWIDEGEVVGSVGRLVAGDKFIEGAECVEREDLCFGLDFERGEIAAD